MKIVIIMIAVLLIGSGAYLTLVQPKSPTVVVPAENTAVINDMVADTMCTSTACMKKMRK